MDVQLKVLVGNNVGQSLKVPGPKFFIGRAEDCHLRPGSDLVSRHHCVLMLEGSSLVVRDFGSKNGTVVNGERVAGECALQNGDHIKVGPLEFEVQMVETLAGAKRSKVTSIKEAAVRTAESGSQADFDINTLLGGGPVDVGDTRELRHGDTAELEVASADTAIITPRPDAPPLGVATPVPPPQAPASPPEKQTGNRRVGKQQVQRKSTENSHDAAAEMLRRLRSASEASKAIQGPAFAGPFSCAADASGILLQTAFTATVDFIRELPPFEEVDLMSTDDDALKRRYREFMDLLPVTLAIAGMSINEGNRQFTSEQLELRSQAIANAFKFARQAVRESIKTG